MKKFTVISFALLFCCVVPTCNSMATRGCKVCISSSCTPNGSEMLLDAMKSLVSSEIDVEIKGDSCLGGCGGGVIVKPFDPSSPNKFRRTRALDPLKDESVAIAAAAELLHELNVLDETKLSDLKSKLDAGDRALSNSEAPEICSQCGVGLQLYRGNCAKCGRYPY